MAGGGQNWHFQPRIGVIVLAEGNWCALLHKLVGAKGNLCRPLEDTAVRPVCDQVFQKEQPSCSGDATGI